MINYIMFGFDNYHLLDYFQCVESLSTATPHMKLRLLCNEYSVYVVLLRL